MIISIEPVDVPVLYDYDDQGNPIYEPPIHPNQELTSNLIQLQQKRMEKSTRTELENKIPIAERFKERIFYAKEEIKLTFDIVSQLLNGTMIQKQTLSIPDSQHLRMTLLAKEPALSVDEKLKRLHFTMESQAICFKEMIQGIESRKLQLSKAIASQKEFVEMFSTEFRKRGWILQSRLSRFGQEFYIDYGFRNAGSNSREVTEARIWKDPLAPLDQMIQIPVKHKKRQWIRISLSNDLHPLDLNVVFEQKLEQKVEQENPIFYELSRAQATVFDLDLYSHLSTQLPLLKHPMLLSFDMNNQGMTLMLKNSSRLCIQLLSEDSQETMSVDDLKPQPIDIYGSILTLYARRLWLENYKNKRCSQSDFPFEYKESPVLPKMFSQIALYENIKRIIESTRAVLSDNGFPIVFEHSQEDSCPLWIVKVMLVRRKIIKIKYIQEKILLSNLDREFISSPYELNTYLYREISFLCLKYFEEELIRLYNVEVQTVDSHSWIGRLYEPGTEQELLVSAGIQGNTRIDCKLQIEISKKEFSRVIWIFKDSIQFETSRVLLEICNLLLV